MIINKNIKLNIKSNIKLFYLAIISIFSITLVSCSPDISTAQIALITDLGTIDDKSFNQGSWEGILQYAQEYDKSYQYYQPLEQSNSSILDTIELAITAGAEVVICPGYFFELPVFEAQHLYPDINFIIIDGVPIDNNGNVFIAQNTSSILYAEHQAGFLAGYSAVLDGYKNLGFMGGFALPAVTNFGYGFIQGAEFASQELNLSEGDISINYTYLNNFDASPENLSKASAWYNDGVEVIFACGGSIGTSIMKAAEITNKKVIGVDVDQSSDSTTIITSAMKNLEGSIYEALLDIENNNFKGGQSIILGADSQNILLPMETSDFNIFSHQDYNLIYSKIATNQIEILDNTSFNSPLELDTSITNIIYN